MTKTHYRPKQPDNAPPRTVKEALFGFIVMPLIFFAIALAGTMLLVRCGVLGAA